MDTTLDRPAVAGYYRLAGELLARQLAGRVVHAAGWEADHSGSRGALDTSEALFADVQAGARWFSWELDTDTPAVAQVGIGEGTDISTAATAALAVVEDLQAQGFTAVPATDGQGGLFVFVPVSVEPPRVDLLQVIGSLALRAPEMATVDADATDGRAWLAAPGVGTLIPAPYSLVDSAEGTGVVFPLAIDELAAVTAGMPLDLTPGDLSDRLGRYGDLGTRLAV